MTPTLAEQIAALVDAEVKRITTEKDAQIADLTTKLKDSEARWGRLRDLLGASPTVAMPLARVPRDRDHLIAAFHAKREIGPVSIAELAAALGVNKANAQWYYSDWCRRNDTPRINYYSNGQRAD